MARRPPGQLRAEILDAAIELLRRYADPALVSVDAVVSAVGCTPPTLYYYFPTKDDLMLEACHREYDAFAADLQAATTHTADARRDLLRRGEAYLAWARAHPAQYRLLFMTPLRLGSTLIEPQPEPEPKHEPEPEPEPEPKHEREHERDGGASADAARGVPDPRQTPGLHDLVADLERAAAAGYSVGDPLVAALACWGMVHGLASLAVTDPEIPEPLLRAAFHWATAGLLPGGAAAADDG